MPTEAAAIAAERTALRLKPWEFAPSEVRDTANPYPAHVAGHQAWERAREQWKALRDAQARRATTRPPRA